MKNGFTLLELAIVVVVIGILGIVGIVQYKKSIENSRTAEAKMILTALREAETYYKLQNQSYSNDITKLDVANSLRNCSQALSYFSFACDSNGTCTATRCTSGGKPPSGPEYSISLTANGSLSTTYGGGVVSIPGGVGTTQGDSGSGGNQPMPH